MFDLSNMDSQDWLGLFFSAFVVLSLPVFLWRYWHNKPRSRMLDEFVARRVYSNKRMQAGQLRNGLAVNLALYPVGLVFLLASVHSDNPRWEAKVLVGLNLAQAISISLFAVFLPVSFVLYWSVMLFNRPSWAVPPDLRQEPGLLNPQDDDPQGHVQAAESGHDQSRSRRNAG